MKTLGLNLFVVFVLSSCSWGVGLLKPEAQVHGLEPQAENLYVVIDPSIEDQFDLQTPFVYFSQNNGKESTVKSKLSPAQVNKYRKSIEIAFSQAFAKSFKAILFVKQVPSSGFAIHLQSLATQQVHLATPACTVSSSSSYGYYVTTTTYSSTLTTLNSIQLKWSAVLFRNGKQLKTSKSDVLSTQTYGIDLMKDAISYSMQDSIALMMEKLSDDLFLPERSLYKLKYEIQKELLFVYIDTSIKNRYILNGHGVQKQIFKNYKDALKKAVEHAFSKNFKSVRIVDSIPVKGDVIFVKRAEPKLINAGVTTCQFDSTGMISLARATLLVTWFVEWVHDGKAVDYSKGTLLSNAQPDVEISSSPALNNTIGLVFDQVDADLFSKAQP